MIGWRVLEEVSFVEWCGHAQHFPSCPMRTESGPR